MLVTGQIALSLLLLIGAGLFIKTLHNLRTADAGFHHADVLLVRVDSARAGYTDDTVLRLYDELLARAAGLPGVRSASFSIIAPPTGGGGISLSVRLNGQPTGAEEFHINAVSPRYFETMGTPVLKGREFTHRDDEAAPKVGVVNQTFVDRHVKGATALGQHLSLGGPGGKQTEMEIVGVVRDAVYETVRAGAPPTVYIPFAQSSGVGGGSVTFEVAGNGSLAQALVRDAFQRQLPRTLVEVRTLTSQVERTLVRDRLMATLATGFGVLGLLLSGIGLSGLLAYLVSVRASEIGVRMALGATRTQVIWMVVRGALGTLFIGAACGLPAALSASRLIASMLFGISPFDTATIVEATTVLIAVGALAAFVPAYRAAAVDPMAALRHD